LLRAFSSSRASWRLRSMEEGSVELIVPAGGCGGSAVKGACLVVDPIRSEGPACAGELLPADGRSSRPVQRACRRMVPSDGTGAEAPPDGRAELPITVSPSRGAGLNNPPCPPVSCPNTPIKGDPM
jgi:hypothetical protein